LIGKFEHLKRLCDEHGSIVIPPELENYEKLKLLVFKKSKTVWLVSAR